jgi:hypothetical protein
MWGRAAARPPRQKTDKTQKTGATNPVAPAFYAKLLNKSMPNY